MRPRLLIVDDHAGFRVSARRLLEAEGFTVVGESDCARSALPALAMLVLLHRGPLFHLHISYPTGRLRRV